MRLIEIKILMNYKFKTYKICLLLIVDYYCRDDHPLSDLSICFGLPDHGKEDIFHNHPLALKIFTKNSYNQSLQIKLCKKSIEKKNFQ